MFPTVDTEENSQVTSLKEKSGVCSDERESSEDSEVAQSKNHIDLTLNMLFKETVICIALSLTVYGAIHSFPPKTSQVSQAVRFFSQDSVVTDWYRGQLSSALAAINLKEVSFVMYYAPWDAESQYVRGEFEKAAYILKDRVHFFAINCWSPGSECRKLHSNILSWPVLITYSVTSNGMLYKGPRNAESIINFLELVMKPLKRVSSTEDLVNLLSIHDAVAVGYTPLTDTSKYYNIWYRVALESLEFDTIGEICFAVVTSEELAQDLGVDTFPSVRLMLWNETKEYKVTESRPWNVSALMSWVLDNFTQPVARMILPWRKAYNFDKFADGNPILMLFTSLNPLYEQLPSYALMREISMEYHSCKNKTDPWTNELIKLQQVQRLIYQQKDYLKFCKEFKFKKPVKRVLPIYKKSVISHNNKYPWNNVTQKNQRGGLFDFVLKQGLFSKMMASSDDSVLWSSLALLQECKSKIFPAEKSFYSNYEQCQLFEEKLNNDIEIELENVETTMLPLEDDPRSPENLMQANVKHFCKLLQFANEIEPQVVPAKVTGNITHIHGLACTTNASLYIVAVDSTRNYHFAEALGIDIANKKDRTAVVILDSQHETQYVLSEEYNAKSVRDFIYNYTMGTLKRSLRTHVENASYTHYYESDNKTDQEKILAENEVQIIDLTTRTFRKLVRSPGMITIVAVCRGGCGAATSRAVLHAARLLAACGAPARVARLDALRHDLPWHYTAHSYPTLLVFTADGSGEAESRALPAQARVSASALVALALRSLRAPLRFRVRLALCARQPAHVERKTCLKDIREHITTLIGRNLKYWRQTDSEEFRNFLLIRLQHLNQVSFHFSLLHVNDLKTNSKRERILLQCLDELARHWDLDLSILRRNDTFVIEPR